MRACKSEGGGGGGGGWMEGGMLEVVGWCSRWSVRWSVMERESAVPY